MTSILFEHGRIIDPNKQLDVVGDVLITDNRIVAIGNVKNMPTGTETIDCTDCIISPGLIDIHVHFREPCGGRHEETIASGAAAAAAGGFTTVCTMPNTTPATDTPELISSAIEIAKNVGKCRVLPTGCATIGRQGKELAPIANMTRAGAIAITDDGNVVENNAMMSKVLQAAYEVDRCFMQHCQDPEMTIGGVMHEGEVQEKLGYGPWPREAEESIIARDLDLNKNIGCAWHAQHLSSGGSVAIIEAAQQAGQRATGEASPHHLLLTDVACETLGTKAKMNPPLRTNKDIETIKDGIKRNVITILATDHAPHPQETKDRPFANASFGVVGIECALALYKKALIDDGTIDWPQLLAMMTLNPANLIGRTDLGRLEIGGIADITVINPHLEWTINASNFLSRARNCPFDGWKVQGKAVLTILGGKITHMQAKSTAC
jgi:dihydroorotase